MTQVKVAFTLDVEDNWPPWESKPSGARVTRRKRVS